MSIFNRFQKPPPPPPPFYRRQPVASAALVLTLFSMLIIGPTQYIARGMDAKIDNNSKRIVDIQKEKATNENVKGAITELKEQRKEQAEANKEQNKSIQTNQIAIEKILIRQEVIKAPGGFQIKDSSKSTEEKHTMREVKKVKPTLTPEQFEKYMTMAPDIRIKYKKYLESTGKDVSGLPD